MWPPAPHLTHACPPQAPRCDRCGRLAQRMCRTCPVLPAYAGPDAHLDGVHTAARPLCLQCDAVLHNAGARYGISAEEVGGACAPLRARPFTPHPQMAHAEACHSCNEVPSGENAGLFWTQRPVRTLDIVDTSAGRTERCVRPRARVHTHAHARSLAHARPAWY